MTVETKMTNPISKVLFTGKSYLRVVNQDEVDCAKQILLDHGVETEIYHLEELVAATEAESLLRNFIDETENCYDETTDLNEEDKVNFICTHREEISNLIFQDVVGKIVNDCMNDVPERVYEFMNAKLSEQTTPPQA